MKLKATLSDRGLRVLERGFLPTLEKFGKQCQLLFGPEDVHLIQTSLNADGLQITARLALASGGRQGLGTGATGRAQCCWLRPFRRQHPCI